MSSLSGAESEIRSVLEHWARATREHRMEDVLQHHSPALVIFDVLPPMQYTSAEAYRASWDEWQPDTAGAAVFDLEELTITAGQDVAFAHSFIRCGGTLHDGRTFEDLVRATFCLRRIDGQWIVEHQHISKPLER